MKTKRRIVETLTEIALAFALLGILGGSFALLRQVNPVATVEQEPVLGASISTLPWEFKDAASFEQTNLVATRNSFVADYNLAIAKDNPVSSFTLFTLNNAADQDVTYRIIFSASEADVMAFKVSALIDSQESLIFDAGGDKKFYNLEVTLPPKSSEDFSLLIKALRSISPEELSAKVTVQIP